MMQWLYRRMPSVLMARRNLSRAKARSILAVVAIVIGVAAIGSLGLFGSAFKTDQLQRFGDIGNDLQVQPGEDNPNRYLTERDLRDIRRSAPGETVVPIKERFMRIEYERETTRSRVYGVENPGEFYEVKEGRLPTTWRKQVLVGSRIAAQLGIEPGDSVDIGGKKYQVAAVLEETGFGSIASADFAFVLPMSQIEGRTYDQVVVRADSTRDANQTAQRIERSMNGRQNRIRVVERGQIADQIDEFFAMLNMFLIGIGAISLVVAGVSILNVMLMSAIERREEIGVFRAVGFQKLDVVRILVTEATLLGLAGSVAGVVLSLLAGLAINDFFLGDPMAFDQLGLSYVVAAFGFGVLTSVLSGLYPAWKAASARPVESLRS